MDLSVRYDFFEMNLTECIGEEEVGNIYSEDEEDKVEYFGVDSFSKNG